MPKIATVIPPENPPLPLILFPPFLSFPVPPFPYPFFPFPTPTPSMPSLPRPLHAQYLSPKFCIPLNKYIIMYACEACLIILK